MRRRSKPTAYGFTHPCRCLFIERLEDRRLLTGPDDSAASDEWLEASYLTLSFAPDGTDVSGHESALFNTLGQVGQTEQWQAAITTAFQTWTQHINLDVGLVSDGGQPFGVSGRNQKDPRFGDVRVGAIPMSSDTLAFAVKHDVLSAGTWAGDLLFNSDVDIESVDEIFRLALHEAGHVLGLDHSDDPMSVMHPQGASGGVELTVGDIASIQALYGERTLDEDDKKNNSIDEATEIGSPDDYQGEIPLVVFGDIQSTTDLDYFEVETPGDYQGAMTLRVSTTGRSFLAPRLSVFDHSGELVGEASSTERLGDSISLTVADAGPEETYFVRVDSSVNDLFGIGGYGLAATFDETLEVSQQAIDAVLGGDFAFLDQNDLHDLFLLESPSFNDDLHRDDSPLTSSPLESRSGFPERGRYRFEAGLTDPTDVDFYRFESSDSGSVMTVSVTALERGGLIPRVTILDQNQTEIPAEVLVNGNGSYVLQIEGVTPTSPYFAKVEASNPAGLNATGNYRLDVRFGDRAVSQETFASGLLTAGAGSQIKTLYVAKTQLFHFVLSAAPHAGTVNALIWSTIYDSNGVVVHRVATAPGETASTQSVLLRPGGYSVRVTSVTADGSPVASVAYSLRGLVIDDPIGPEIIDPTEAPLVPCQNDASQLCYPDGTVYNSPYNSVDDDLISLPDGTVVDPLWVDWDSWYWYSDPFEQVVQPLP